MNHFPLETHITAYCSDDDIKNEEPCLLNPYSEEKKDNPSLHLRFAPPVFTGNMPKFVGTVRSITDRGEKTVEICNLAHGPLNEARKVSQESFFDFCLSRMLHSAKDIIEQVKNGEKDHSAALFIVFNAITEMNKRREEEARKELDLPEDYFSETGI